ncbi:MAG: hypothetical protein V1754_09285, partial [Pseudomonadota bacterium]
MRNMLSKGICARGKRGGIFLFSLAIGMSFGCGEKTLPIGDSGLGGDALIDSGGDSDGVKARDGLFDIDALPPDMCTPEIVDCTDICGPVTEPCTGTTFECGGCADGLVCDIDAHKCITPLGTCGDLQAECGTIKNSCGERLDCGYCPSGEECDPDTNTCVTCTAVTCQDVGFSCGTAWLGCGPSSNKTDCGACEAGKVCNGVYNICEPVCTPDEASIICADANANQGVECGFISDGCGGVVDCGNCPEGLFCGVRGVANRCEIPEKPSECIAQGKNCGKITSACGGEVECGECDPGDVCNPNNVCGPPCTPKTCNSGYAGKCGKQLDDGCSGKLNCDCASGLICDTATPGQSGTCITPKTCSTYSAEGQDGQTCSNGDSPAFPRGDGKDLTCPCKDGRFCVDNGKEVKGADVGTCCTNTAACDGTTCTVTNTCTSAAINCCTSKQYCDAPTDKCKDKKVCADYTDSKDGSPCSNTKI